MGGLAALLLIAGCSSSGGGSSSTPTSSNPAEWNTPLAATTCDQWLHVMTGAQRFSVAQELIRALDAKDQSDGFARRFETDLDTDCGAGGGLGLKLDEVAATLAALEPDDFN